MLVTKSAFTHVRQFDCSFGARVHEPIATQRVKLGCGNDFSQLLHVRGLNVNNVEALILYVEIPEIDSEIVTADEGLAIAVYGYAVDVIGMRIGVGFAGNGCYDGIVMGQTGELEIGGILEMDVRVPDRTTSTSNASTWCEFM